MFIPCVTQKMKTQTHMPFLTFVDNKRFLFYCKKINNVWKIHCNQLRINTHLQEDVTECSPAAWHDQNGWHLSFIATHKENCYLIKIEGRTLDDLSEPVSITHTFCGYIFQNTITFRGNYDTFYIKQNNEIEEIQIPNSIIYRITYRADQPQKIIISGVWVSQQLVANPEFSLEYCLLTRSYKLIRTADTSNIYKCTIWNNEIIHAKKKGKDFEDRSIYKSQVIYEDLETTQNFLKQKAITYQQLKNKQQMTSPDFYITPETTNIFFNSIYCQNHTLCHQCLQDSAFRKKVCNLFETPNIITFQCPQIRKIKDANKYQPVVPIVLDNEPSFIKERAEACMSCGFFHLNMCMKNNSMEHINYYIRNPLSECLHNPPKWDKLNYDHISLTIYLENKDTIKIYTNTPNSLDAVNDLFLWESSSQFLIIATIPPEIKQNQLIFNNQCVLDLKNLTFQQEMLISDKIILSALPIEKTGQILGTLTNKSYFKIIPSIDIPILYNANNKLELNELPACQCEECQQHRHELNIVPLKASNPHFVETMFIPRKLSTKYTKTKTKKFF